MHAWLLTDEAAAPTMASPPSPGEPRTVRRLASMGADSLKALGLRRAFDDELESVFSSLRSQSTEDLNDELEKNRRYAEAGPVARALPERYVALLVTLAVEVPVALIISSGSHDLKSLIGSDRYTLLMAFLPLTSAISGNVGLQASTLTCRAISHGDCSKASYCRWLWTEVKTALILALLTGVAVGLLALVWTSNTFEAGADLGFAMTVGLAQAFSIAIAGLTGTCAPLLFSFIFHGDAGKWAGPMETAVQDIAGSFAMVYIAQVLLLQFVRLGLSPVNTELPGA